MAGHGHTHAAEQEGGCSCALHSSGVAQSMQELEFERGIWPAAMDGELSKVEKLIKTGVCPSATDSSGYTALHYASRSGHLKICQLLISSGASVNAQTPGGVTPLHRAAYCGHVEVARLLLECGGNTELVDSDGRTALHKAAERGQYEVAALLVAARPDLVNVRDKRDLSAIDLVKTPDDKCQSGTNTPLAGGDMFVFEIVLLVDCQLSVGVTDRMCLRKPACFSPLCMAAERQQYEVAALLVAAKPNLSRGRDKRQERSVGTRFGQELG